MPKAGVQSLLKQGVKSFYFVTVDYAFGTALQADMTVRLYDFGAIAVALRVDEDQLVVVAPEGGRAEVAHHQRHILALELLGGAFGIGCVRVLDPRPRAQEAHHRLVPRDPPVPVGAGREERRVHVDAVLEGRGLAVEEVEHQRPEHAQGGGHCLGGVGGRPARERTRRAASFRASSTATASNRKGHRCAGPAACSSSPSRWL